MSHIHTLDMQNRCTIEGCDYVLVIPPICVSIEVTNRREVLVSEAFNTSTVDGAIRALRQAADALERRRF